MTKKEKKLLAAFLRDAADVYGSNGCNDVPRHIEKLLTKKEWAALNKKYHEYNGDPEEENSNYPIADFCYFDYFAHVLENE